MLKLVHAYDMNFSSVLEYYNSFEGNFSDLNCYAIEHVRLGVDEYFGYVSKYEENLYYLVDDTNPNYIIGFGSIEDSDILDYHESYLNTGSIGYGVRYSERNKGYGTIILKLLLIRCEELGMREVCVSCLERNTASKKIIEKNNGKLEKRFFDDDSCKYGLKYWIKLYPRATIWFKRTKRIRDVRKKYGL